MKPIVALLLCCYCAIACSQDFTMQHNGLERSYRLHLPSGYSSDSLYPLVISMHGVTSNAWQQEWLTGFNSVADAHNFIVVYPNGVNASWNISSSTGVDDVGFISALIDTLHAAYPIDLNRVYASGMSMGGFMSYRLACQLSDRIAAIASVTGLLAFSPCNPTKPVPVLQMHGTSDPVVPYVGVATTISHWVEHNGCPMEPIITELPDVNTSDSSTVTISYYGLCNNSTEVILYTIVGGEHSWPGSIINLGVTNHDISASNEIWNFFRKYNLQGSTDINESKSASVFQFDIHPNPARGHATIELDRELGESFDFRIFDLSGQCLMNIHDLTGTRFVVEYGNIPAGLYLAEISYSGGMNFQKIVIY